MHRKSSIPENPLFPRSTTAIFAPEMPDTQAPSTHQHTPATLLLEDGTLYRGYAFGAPGTAGGELCFNTGMTGYQEVFTDPSYTGQVLIMNNAYIGNYGVKEGDVESERVTVSGIIARNLSDRYSRMTAAESLEEYLTRNGVPGICGVDTRALVQHVRSKGAMNCIISTELTEIADLQKALDAVPDMQGLELSSTVSTKEHYELGDPEAKLRIAVLDFGVKRHSLESWVERGAHVKVFPAKTPFETIAAYNPHGVYISNGPGDPAAMDYAVKTVQDILAAKVPAFGICLGHQLLARASGITTYKMHHGHRGLNHPVKNLRTGKSEITTQNHGFGVDQESVKSAANVEVTHINLNDGSIEGIRRTDVPAFSVQYHPESTPGPHDSRYLFDDFLQLIEETSSNRSN